MKAEPRHGTPSTYVSHRCRCDACRHAWAIEQRGMRRARQAALQRGEGPADLPHGTVSTYANWGCRCERCRRANTEGMRLYRERRREP